MGKLCGVLVFPFLVLGLGAFFIGATLLDNAGATNWLHGYLGLFLRFVIFPVFCGLAFVCSVLWLFLVLGNVEITDDDEAS